MTNKSPLRGIAVGSLIAGVALAVGFGGVSYAANGGSLILGKANKESATATLRNTAGTPLSLVAPAGKAPLRVNGTTKVGRLNADLLDGLDSAALQRRVTGSCAAGQAIRSVDPTGAVACEPIRVAGAAVVRLSGAVLSPSEGPINRQARVYCLPGEHAVGGGSRVSALTADRLGEYFNFVVDSAPITSTTGEAVADGEVANGWLVESTNLASQLNGAVSGKNANLFAYVICAPN